MVQLQDLNLCNLSDLSCQVLRKSSKTSLNGGLTLRRGDSAAQAAGPSKLVTVSVVGLSGGEREKGSMGIGKSCLCNRFVAPLADDYHVDHISVLSQSDFSGRVVNNDHFLYWGDIVKTNEEGVDFHIQVIEQTEFIDDASFQPFRASGKQEPYVRRCANTRVVSAEKLMYICKNQLGIEKEFDQRLMPEGKVSIDGFICVFDVSLVPNRTLEKQVETSAQILNNLLKSKKPVVLVTTKNDEGNEIFMREAERLVNRKEYKGTVALVETSSHENINVDQAFFLVASLVDRTRGRTRVLSYADANRHRRELLELATAGFMRLVQGEVTDYGVTWSIAAKKLSQYQEFQNYLDIFGADAAQRLFRRHVKKLKDSYLSERVARYLNLLPEVLHELFPDVSTLGEDCYHLFHWNPTTCGQCRQIQSNQLKPWDWILVQQRIREHQDFDRWFVEYPEDTTWMEANLFDGDSSEHRIPFDVLDSTEAETVYKNLLNQLNAEQNRLELRKDFKQLLEETGYVTPGKKLDEVRVLFMGRECFESLPEMELHQIYELHQQDLIERCKKNFQELLLEKADLFYQFRSSPAGTVTQDDILDITDNLAEDGRYKALDRMDADRKLLLFQHLGFVHCPIREHCPAFPNCTDAIVERVVSKRVARPSSWMVDNNHLNLILLGADKLANDLSSQIQSQCPNKEFEHGGQVFNLELRIISGDVDLPQNNFKTSEFLPQGCFCVYSDVSSFEYIRSSLEKTLLSNLEKDDGLPFQGLPLVILFQPDSTKLAEKDGLRLQEEGQNLADSLQCPFIDEGWDEIKEGGVVEDSLRSLVESIRHRSGVLSIAPPMTEGATQPDLRVIMCLHCGDPYSIEKVLGPLLGHSTCHQSGERSVCVEQKIDDKNKKVEVILSSYHSAIDFREELVHGFILVYSSRRKASIATLSAFSMNIPELPIQLVAVTDSSAGNFHQTAELNQVLVAEGNNLADQLNAHFLTSETNQRKSNFYNSFFREVCDKKAEIEKAFSMDDRLSGRLDDSGEGTLERPPRRHPIPPPRIDSYHIRDRGPSSLNSRSGSGRSGSGSEIFDRLPDSGLHGDELDASNSDDSDVYSQIDSLDRQKKGPQVRRLNGDVNRQQIKASQLKSRKNKGSAPPECSPPPIPAFPPRPKFTTSPLNKEPPPAYSRTQESSPKSGVRERLDRPPPYSRIPQQSTFGTSIPKTSMYKAESMTLETMRGGDRSNHSSFFPEQGWADDSNISGRRVEEDERLSSKYNQGAFTTGRRGNKKPETLTQRSQESILPPGKLNLSDYHNVTTALSRMTVKQGRSAPLADVEDLGDDGSGYAVPRDVINGVVQSEYAQPMVDAPRPKPRSKNRERRERAAKLDISDSETDSSSDERPPKKPGAVRKARKKRSAIPVATPVVPTIPTPIAKIVEEKPIPAREIAPEKRYSDSEESDSYAGDGHFQQPLRRQPPTLHSPFMFPPPPTGPPPPENDLYNLQSHVEESPKQVSTPQEDTVLTTDKQKKKIEKELKTKQKEMAKQEKKEKEKEERENKAKIKEEKKKEKQDKKTAGRSNMKANSVQGQPSMDDFRASDDNPIPVFLSRCIEFIELEGLLTEGLYRVPGNRAHVDLLFQKFDEDQSFDMHSLDIAVNAVATAVKDFFFKRLPPLLPQEHMGDLEQISMMQDRHMRLLEIKKLLERMPKANHAVVKFIFQHFVRVTERSKINCMDSKNLAICWWPTLLQYEFGDLGKFESMRPHLEDVVQTFIDQYRFLFCGLEEVMMV
eukprot:GFUD01008321.1.p1 GENE.GFUD01008321.1~~GFUD01008321.1.p1  ORF type:complete len:1765 (+),score=291.33 GFUD01008321.1:752-6046(+)